MYVSCVEGLAVVKWCALFLVGWAVWWSVSFWCWCGWSDFSMPIGLIGGAALSNVYDRFVHEGVVDYFFWHYGFEFAVFNFADVMIDLGVILIFYRSWKMAKEAKST